MAFKRSAVRFRLAPPNKPPVPERSGPAVFLCVQPRTKPTASCCAVSEDFPVPGQHGRPLAARCPGQAAPETLNVPMGRARIHAPWRHRPKRCGHAPVVPSRRRPATACSGACPGRWGAGHRCRAARKAHRVWMRVHREAPLANKAPRHAGRRCGRYRQAAAQGWPRIACAASPARSSERAVVSA
jgi:hypothetical protein